MEKGRRGIEEKRKAVAAHGTEIHRADPDRDNPVWDWSSLRICRTWILGSRRRSVRTFHTVFLLADFTGSKGCAGFMYI